MFYVEDFKTMTIWLLEILDSTSSGDGMYGMMKAGGMPNMAGVSTCVCSYS